MKKIILYAAILLFVAGNFSSCGDRDDMPRFFFAEFSLAGMNLLVDYDETGEDRVIVINSMQELEKYMEYVEAPDIDFTTHSLLLAAGVVENVIAGVAGSIEQLSKHGGLLNVEVATRFHPLDPQLWAVAFVTGKLNNECAIVLEKTVNCPDLAGCSPAVSAGVIDCLCFWDFDAINGFLDRNSL